MFDKSQPLGLPKGSVRAIIALVLVLTFCFKAVTSNFTLTADNVVTIVVMVVGFYFVAAAQKAQAPSA